MERFSGGEKARLTLALLVARRPNLLLLDEPTNHLDIDMRHALTVALQSFEGGMVIVSHDRHLIKTVADSLWLVADGKLEGVRRRLGRLPAKLAVREQDGAGRADQGNAQAGAAGRGQRRLEIARPIGRACAAKSSRSSSALPQSPRSERWWRRSCARTPCMADCRLSTPN